MNKYKKLSGNLLIYAIGTLSSKLISLILVPIYTRHLSTSEYGSADLILVTVAMLTPIISACIYDAVLRYSLDQTFDRQSVFTNALVSTSLVYLVLGGLFVILNITVFKFENFEILMILLLLQIYESILAQYLRAKGEIKKFALKGIVLTFSIGALSILNVVILSLGVKGFLWSYIAAYFISIVFMTLSGKLYKDLDFKKVDIVTTKILYKYSIPLMPNSTLWWIINSSSKFFLGHSYGTSANGLFAVSTKIPAVITMITTVFNQGWQVAAIEEYENDDKSEFYSNVFSVLSTTLFVGGLAILLILKDVFRLFLADAYFDAWKAVPFLVMGTIFSSFSSFLGINYVASEKTTGALKTSVFGGAVCLALNWLLIPQFGLIGAGVSNVLGFLVMWIIRVIDTKKIVKIQINWMKMISYILIYLAATFVLFSGLALSLQRILIFLLLVIALLLNIKNIIKLINLRTSVFKKN